MSTRRLNKRAAGTIRALSRETGLSRATVYRALSGSKVSETTLRKLENFKGRLRTEGEVNRIAYMPPRRQLSSTEWSIERVRCAVDAQMRGEFREAVRLAEVMKKDDAMFVAFHNRIAPQFAIETELVSASGARGAATAKRAQGSCIVTKSVLASLHGTLADHGIAIGYVEQETNAEGTRTDFRLTEWPLEHVKYNTSTELLTTHTKDGGAMQIITHGDGRWIVFRKFYVEPWKKEAAVLPGGMVWAAHQYCLVDWAAAARSHGRAKVLGTLPEGFALADEAGALTPEAQSFLEVLSEVLEGEAGAGMKEFGAEADFISNPSNAWQVFSELAADRTKAGARIYLGTDAILGSVGGAPGIDISTLFQVAATKLEGDFGALEEGLYSGLYQPWAAVNEGDSRNAPRLRYCRPDPDKAQTVDQIDKRRAAFSARVKELKEMGAIVDQAVINKLAAEYKIDPPQLAPIASAAVPLTLAPTDVAKAVTIDEIRRSQGLPPLGTPRGAMTLDQAAAADKTATGVAVAEAGAPPAPAPAPAPTTNSAEDELYKTRPMSPAEADQAIGTE
jgi:hypothetical protein